jgi:hypothetical protein
LIILSTMDQQSTKKVKYCYLKPFVVTILKIVQFLGIQILIENLASENFKQIKNHFNYIQKNYNIRIFFYKYKAIRSFFEPTLEELVNFLIC